MKGTGGWAGESGLGRKEESLKKREGVEVKRGKIGGRKGEIGIGKGNLFSSHFGTRPSRWPYFNRFCCESLKMFDDHGGLKRPGVTNHAT